MSSADLADSLLSMRKQYGYDGRMEQYRRTGDAKWIYAASVHHQETDMIARLGEWQRRKRTMIARLDAWQEERRSEFRARKAEEAKRAELMRRPRVGKSPLVWT